MKNESKNRNKITRRNFIKNTAIGVGGLGLTAYGLRSILIDNHRFLQIGFPNDASKEIWKWSREAEWWNRSGGMIRCLLCPHECHLRENDRGFCRTRVVKNGKLYTLAYENPCAVNIDPIEKKPLYHFLPGTTILSLATAGCNLRCLNCQNWDISQAKPDDVKNMEVKISEMVDFCVKKNIPSLAYTYSEPIAFYEYTKDASLEGRKKGIKNVLVTAGYINEMPAREIARVVDAANIDIKAFSEYTYKKLTGSRLEPVLTAIKAMKEEGMWIELTRLIVPNYSDDLADIRKMCRWIVETLGPGTPLHFSRFHPDHKLKNIAPTPDEIIERSYEIAMNEGLNFVYIGNMRVERGQSTICPKCKEEVIIRDGYTILKNEIRDGKCPCGEKIPGIWMG